MSEIKLEKPSILAIVAHPDDESFGLGGTLALYAKRGADVHIIVTTDGQAGTVDDHFLENYNSISELREAELRCAVEKLGAASLHMFRYRDSGMADSADSERPDAFANQFVEAVAAKIVQVIREVRPTVVITHDPIGGYLHPDHIATQRATLHAFRSAGDPDAYPDEPLPPYQPQKLYYTTFPKGILKAMVFLLKLFRQNPSKFGRNQDIDILKIVEAGSFPIHTRIDYRSVVKIRDEASACHASQLPGGPPNRGLASIFFRLISGKDTYMRAYPEANGTTRETDLFEGVSDPASI